MWGVAGEFPFLPPHPLFFHGNFLKK